MPRMRSALPIEFTRVNSLPERPTLISSEDGLVNSPRGRFGFAARTSSSRCEEKTSTNAKIVFLLLLTDKVFKCGQILVVKELLLLYETA